MILQLDWKRKNRRRFGHLILLILTYHNYSTVSREPKLCARTKLGEVGLTHIRGLYNYT